MGAELAVVAAAALVLNVPMGMWREQTRRFSWQWFLAIHLPVPFVAALRIGWDLPVAMIPVLLGVSIAGQVIGSRHRRRRLRFASEEIGPV